MVIMSWSCRPILCFIVCMMMLMVMSFLCFILYVVMFMIISIVIVNFWRNIKDLK